MCYRDPDYMFGILGYSIKTLRLPYIPWSPFPEFKIPPPLLSLISIFLIVIVLSVVNDLQVLRRLGVEDVVE